MITAVHVVVPAHDEETLIGACLSALGTAAARVPVPVTVHVVLDACTDRTAEVCASYRVEATALDARNVGAARAAGFAAVPAAPGLWLATTDADTRVPPDWLSVQLALADAGADAVLGVVDVDDWSDHPVATRQAFLGLYADAAPGTSRPHPHVHGANLGVRATAYRRAGGFRPVPVGEDRDLAARLDADPGCRVVRSVAVRAVTSARRDARAQGGFGDLLATLC